MRVCAFRVFSVGSEAVIRVNMLLIGGFVLVYLMGEKAIIGALACCVLGVITYYTYGKSNVQHTLTPWRTVRTEFTNSDQHEREQRWSTIGGLTSRGWWNEGATYGIEFSAKY